MKLYKQIASYSNLVLGFDKVSENDGMPGSDGVSIYAFEENLHESIIQLKNQLESFSYKPEPLLMLERSKADGTKRILLIPSVKDRVVQSSAYHLLYPIIDKELEQDTYAYRQGFSREAAVRKIHSLFNLGYKWILDADITHYFDRINHDLLFQRLQEIIPEKAVTDLIKKWIKAEYIWCNQKYFLTKGIPQGAVISPLLANLYLDSFDEGISKHGLKFVRYADDFIILTKSKSEAERALEITIDLLNMLQLEINTDKTKITNFDSGFKYIGYIFLKSLVLTASPKDTSKPLANVYNTPQILKTAAAKLPKDKKNVLDENKFSSSVFGDALLKAINAKGISLNQFYQSLNDEIAASAVSNEDDAIAEIIEYQEASNEIVEESKKNIPPPESKPNISTLKHTLYIQEQGAVLKKDSNKFVVIKDEQELIDIPIIKVKEIFIFGNCTVSPSVMQTCLRSSIPIILLSSRGKYFGRLDSTDISHGDLTRFQTLRTFDNEFLINFYKKTLSAKINNSKVFFQRHFRRKGDEHLQILVNYLKNLIGKIEFSNNIDELRGIEGNAAAAYFSSFSLLFDSKTGYHSEKFIRVKHPPTDPINSLLSFGYTLLGSIITSFIFARNLNPYIGFVHQLRPNHPALTSDIIEEFRVIIDSLVVQIINKHILTHNHFYSVKEPGMPCFLTNNGRKIFLHQFEIKMHQKTLYPLFGTSIDFIKCIDLQIQQLVQYIRGEISSYQPYTINY
jgi:CRISPR-associated protein Cas1